MNDATQPGDLAPVHSRRFEFLSLNDIKAELHNRHLVKGWFDRGEFSLIYGDSNVGKTFVALDLAFHVAAGLDWHGNRVPSSDEVPPLTVAYIAAEGGFGMNARIEAIKIGAPDLYERARRNNTFFLLKSPVDLHGGGDLNALIGDIERLPRPVDLIIVDTLARSMGDGDENSTKDMSRLIDNVRRLQAETGAHVMLVHHTGKNTDKGARGSSALRAAATTEIFLSRRGQVISCKATKQRELEGGREISFVLETIEIGQDEDGDLIRSAILRDEVLKLSPRAKLNSSAQVALRALADLSNTAAEDPEFNVVPLEVWRKRCEELGITSGTAPSALQTAFKRAQDELERFGLVEIQNGNAALTTETKVHTHHNARQGDVK